jgi:hypothetical protein
MSANLSIFCGCSGDIDFDEFIKFVFPTGEVTGAGLRAASVGLSSSKVGGDAELGPPLNYKAGLRDDGIGSPLSPIPASPVHAPVEVGPEFSSSGQSGHNVSAIAL